MGHMMSHLKEIEALRFERFPVRGLRAKGPMRIARASEDGPSFAVEEAHPWLIYTTSKVAMKAAFTHGGDWHWQRDVLRALVKLKVIPQKVADDHQKQGDLNSKYRSSIEDMRLLESRLKKYGLVLTSKQRKAVKGNWRTG